MQSNLISAFKDAEGKLNAFVNDCKSDLSQIQQKSAQLHNFFQIIFDVFDSIIRTRLINSVETKVDLITPLCSLLCLANNMEEEKHQLVRLLSRIMWYTLTDSTVQTYTLGVGGIANATFTWGTHQVHKYYIMDHLLVAYTLNRESSSDYHITYEDSVQFLLQIKSTIEKVSTHFAQLDDSRQSSSSISNCLAELLRLSVDPMESEITTLALVSEPTFVRRLHDMKRNELLIRSEFLGKCMNKLLKVLSGNLQPKYLPLYLHNQDLFSGFVSEDLKKFSTTDICANYELKHEGLQNAFHFLLELLDQGTHICYLDSARLVENLVMSVHAINHLLYNRKCIYHNFNLCTSKISAMTCFSYLNYLTTVNLMSSSEIQNIAATISKHFRQFVLPPLSKSERFTEDNGPLKDEFNISTVYQVKNTNYYSLRYSLLVTLNIIHEMLEDDFKAVSFMSNCSTETLDHKIVFELVDLVLSSLVNTLMFVQSRSSDYLTATIKKHVYNITNKLLNLRLKSINNSLIWICLINLANDICYSDIGWLQTFEQLFDYLIKENKSILEDGLVLSGLEFFKSTFHYGSSSVKNTHMVSEKNRSFVPLSLTEFKSLYEKEPSSFDASPRQAMVYSDTQKVNNTSSRYITNSARQQSIHVDQFSN